MEPLLVPLLQVIAFYCVLDGIQIVFVGAIKGAGDTWFVLLATFSTVWRFGHRGLGLARILGRQFDAVVVRHRRLGYRHGIGLLAAYVQGAWESKRVIEQKLG